MGLITEIFGRNGKGSLRPIAVDNSSDSQILIEYGHHEIHEGKTFAISTTTTSLADAATQEFILTVGGTDEAHMLVEGSAGGDALLTIHESPTGVAGTNDLTPRNVNRNSDRSSSVGVIQNPDSIGSDGTIMFGKVLGGGEKNSASGASGQSRNEIILKPGLVYLLRLTNIAGAAKAAGLFVEWYEHTPKN